MLGTMDEKLKNRWIFRSCRFNIKSDKIFPLETTLVFGVLRKAFNLQIAVFSEKKSDIHVFYIGSNIILNVKLNEKEEM